MNKVNRVQKEKLQQFTLVTGISERSAISTLRAADWNLEAAIEYFYSNPAAAPVGSQADSRKVLSFFKKYKDPEHDMVLVDGITKLCEDLQVEPSDIVMLVISWHLRASTACEFTKSEFVEGMRSLGVDSVEKLRTMLPTLRAELKDERKYHEIYLFAFDWAKEKGQKSLALDTAIPMWNLLFAGRNWSHLDRWCDFVVEKHNKAISRDTWTQLLEFAKTIRTDLSNYDADGAWPYLIDEYVDFLKQQG